MMSKWLYRLESISPDNGLWYAANGSKYVFGIGKIDGCKTKDLPMDYDIRYHKDGKNWFSSCSNKEDLLHWYSLDDARKLLANGFVFTRYLAQDYTEYENETVFLKETALKREEIDLFELFPSVIGEGINTDIDDDVKNALMSNLPAPIKVLMEKTMPDNLCHCGKSAIEVRKLQEEVAILKQENEELNRIIEDNNRVSKATSKHDDDRIFELQGKVVELQEGISELLAGMCCHCNLCHACQEGEDGMSAPCNLYLKWNKVLKGEE